jgi:hypothetical protein
MGIDRTAPLVILAMLTLLAPAVRPKLGLESNELMSRRMPIAIP